MEVFYPKHLIILAYVISLSVAGGMLMAAHLRPQLGRFFYALLFLFSGQFNWWFAVKEPEIYLNYGSLAVLPSYRSFILGYFADHITVIVGCIATAHLLIGLSMITAGRFLRQGSLAGIAFLVAIAPLGAGSAFPCTLLLAAGLFLLYRQSFEANLFRELARWS